MNYIELVFFLSGKSDSNQMLPLSQALSEDYIFRTKGILRVETPFWSYSAPQQHPQACCPADLTLKRPVSAPASSPLSCRASLLGCRLSLRKMTTGELGGWISVSQHSLMCLHLP